jgi:hypothetical protein
MANWSAKRFVQDETRLLFHNNDLGQSDRINIPYNGFDPEESITPQQKVMKKLLTKLIRSGGIVSPGVVRVGVDRDSWWGIDLSAYNELLLGLHSSTAIALDVLIWSISNQDSSGFQTAVSLAAPQYCHLTNRSGEVPLYDVLMSGGSVIGFLETEILEDSYSICPVRANAAELYDQFRISNLFRHDFSARCLGSVLAAAAEKGIISVEGSIMTGTIITSFKLPRTVTC